MKRVLRRTSWTALFAVLVMLAAGLPASVGDRSPAPAAPTATVPVAATTLQMGMRGPAVRDLQQRLVNLHYWLGAMDGIYGPLTAQAVMAFQKVNGLTPDASAGPQTFAALANPVAPRPQSRSGLVIEVPKQTQVVLQVRNGAVVSIFNSSTGKSSTPTPSGHFEVYRQINGWRQSPLGMLYRPKYFTGGYALHGSTSVPSYPASHGCVRVSTRAMDHLWTSVPIGTPVWIY